jgi:hypothetical protein
MATKCLNHQSSVGSDGRIELGHVGQTVNILQANTKLTGLEDRVPMAKIKNPERSSVRYLFRQLYDFREVLYSRTQYCNRHAIRTTKCVGTEGLSD